MTPNRPFSFQLGAQLMIAVKKSLDEQKHFTQRAKQHLFPLTPFSGEPMRHLVC